MRLAGRFATGLDPCSKQALLFLVKRKISGAK